MNNLLSNAIWYSTWVNVTRLGSRNFKKGLKFHKHIMNHTNRIYFPFAEDHLVIGKSKMRNPILLAPPVKLELSLVSAPSPLENSLQVHR